jgi:hypothetical protein
MHYPLDVEHETSFWPLYHRLVPYTPVQLKAGLSWPKHQGGEKTTSNFPEPRPANSSKASHITDRVILAHMTADIKNVLNYASNFLYIFIVQSSCMQQFLHFPEEHNLPSVLTPCHVSLLCTAALGLLCDLS